MNILAGVISNKQIKLYAVYTYMYHIYLHILTDLKNNTCLMFNALNHHVVTFYCWHFILVFLIVPQSLYSKLVVCTYVQWRISCQANSPYNHLIKQSLWVFPRLPVYNIWLESRLSTVHPIVISNGPYYFFEPFVCSRLYKACYLVCFDNVCCMYMLWQIIDIASLKHYTLCVLSWRQVFHWKSIRRRTLEILYNSSSIGRKNRSKTHPPIVAVVAVIAHRQNLSMLVINVPRFMPILNLSPHWVFFCSRIPETLFETSIFSMRKPSV